MKECPFKKRGDYQVSKNDYDYFSCNGNSIDRGFCGNYAEFYKLCRVNIVPIGAKRLTSLEDDRDYRGRR